MIIIDEIIAKIIRYVCIPEWWKYPHILNSRNQSIWVICWFIVREQSITITTSCLINYFYVVKDRVHEHEFQHKSRYKSKKIFKEKGKSYPGDVKYLLSSYLAVLRAGSSDHGKGPLFEFMEKVAFETRGRSWQVADATCVK